MSFQNHAPEVLNQLDLSLDFILKKRVGGAANIAGVRFQALYAVYASLSKLQPGENVFIQFEGIEDIDFHSGEDSLFIQVKTSQNVIDANRLWDLKVLQNFYEVYLINPNSEFLLIHNTSFSKGNIEVITGLSKPSEQVNYWLQKFDGASIKTDKERLQQFFCSITFCKMTEEELVTSINKILIEQFDINRGTITLFLKGLFFYILEQSKIRGRVSFQNVSEVIQVIKDSISKGAVNAASKNEWISKVLFENNKDVIDLGYYDGKAARPSDITNKLPVERPIWLKQILESVEVFDVTIIRSSSGQGKSTIAWQSGLSLLEKGYSIFQLNYCKDWDVVVANKDFILSRIAIGQVPVIVIDGLSSIVSAWNTLAENLRGVPVKFIITTRQEDWIRYGSNSSNINLKLIDISLSIQEAKDIFFALKKHNKLHSDKLLWQSAWEATSSKGLLIEYVYLLTKGESLHNRLYQQVQTISNEESGAVKLEMLRIISVADILNIRLQTGIVTKYVAEKFKQKVDLNEVYRQLEKEYYLRFDEKFIQGLHPVRSGHLKNILHSHISVSETLLTILQLLNEQGTYDFFMNTGLLFPELEADFFEMTAKILSKRKPSEMVFAIDGLMHSEPVKYWLQNKNVYDSAFESGGIELFVYDSVPFNKLNILESFSNSMPDEQGNNFRNLLIKAKELKEYSFSHSNILTFSTALFKEFIYPLNITNYEGMTFLFKWFKRLELEAHTPIKFDNIKVLESLYNKSLTEVSDMCSLYYLIDPEKYKHFAETNKAELLAYLKKQTNTLSLYEKDGNVYIEYLLDNDAEKVNEMSVFRINTVYSLLPFYNHYCTDVIILPFPNEDIYKAVVQNAHKKMPVKNIYDLFDTHLNRIWSKAILDKYSHTSAYEWQEAFFAYRNMVVGLAKEVTYLFEAHLQGNTKTVKSQVKSLVNQANEFLKYDTGLKRYPSSTIKHFEDDVNAKQINKIDSWRASFRNFINQMSGIIIPKNDHDRSLPVINLSDAIDKVTEMQNAYIQLGEQSYSYFSTESLIQQEVKVLQRLLDTVLYYSYTAKNNLPMNIPNPNREIIIWNETALKTEMENLYRIFDGAEAASAFSFYKPDKITKQGSLKYCSLGIGNFNILDEEQLFELSLRLFELANTGIHFFTFVIVDDKMEVIGAFRVGDNYCKKFENLINDNPIDESDWGNPIPLIPDENTVATLPGIKLKPVVKIQANDAYFTMMINCWKLSEYRNRLDQKNTVEKKWLSEIENELIKSISDDVEIVYKNNAEILPHKNEIEEFIKGSYLFTTDEIIQLIKQKAIELSSH